MEGDAWDAEHERLNQLWKAEYRSTFVELAASRPGWTEEHAKGWADGLLEDAHPFGSDDPSVVARKDVQASELEWDYA